MHKMRSAFLKESAPLPVWATAHVSRVVGATPRSDRTQRDGYFNRMQDRLSRSFLQYTECEPAASSSGDTNQPAHHTDTVQLASLGSVPNSGPAG